MKDKSYIWISLVILVFGIWAVPKIIKKFEKADLMVIGTAPQFELVDQNNKTINNNSYKGKVYVVEFFFANCPTICPIMNANMIDVYKRQGYSKGSQAVLLPSFIAAYEGKDANKVSTGLFRNIPLPNWNLKYRGLMKIDWFKEHFKNFSINHGYRASYTLGSFSYNTDYYKAPNAINKYGDYPSKYVVNNATMYEQFNPLVRFDAETKSSIRMSLEMRKDRMLSLSFDNNLLTETNGNDFVLGLGYRVKDVGFNSMYANQGMGGRISSDINIKADLTLTKRETVVRYLDYGNSQSGGGQDMWSLRLTADYMLSKNLTAIFFYDHSFSKAVISTMYPITNIRAGFTMRYNFGN